MKLTFYLCFSKLRVSRAMLPRLLWHKENSVLFSFMLSYSRHVHFYTKFQKIVLNFVTVQHTQGRDCSVGIATCYGYGGPGIESRWGRNFPHPSKPALGPIQPSIKWVPGLPPGVKRPGRGVNHPPPSSDEGKERAEV